MTNKDDRDIKKEMINMLQSFSSDIVKCVFTMLDVLLSQCNSFEDFKVGVKQTVDALIEEESENDKE